jgi:hypothetical protein
MAKPMSDKMVTAQSVPAAMPATTLPIAKPTGSIAPTTAPYGESAPSVIGRRLLVDYKGSDPKGSDTKGADTSGESSPLLSRPLCFLRMPGACRMTSPSSMVEGCCFSTTPSDEKGLITCIPCPSPPWQLLYNFF